LDSGGLDRHPAGPECCSKDNIRIRKSLSRLQSHFDSYLSATRIAVLFSHLWQSGQNCAEACDADEWTSDQLGAAERDEAEAEEAEEGAAAAPPPDERALVDMVAEGNCSTESEGSLIDESAQFSRSAACHSFSAVQCTTQKSSCWCVGSEGRR
jgi:hypothetical protein